MSLFGTPSTPAGQSTGFSFGSGGGLFTPQTPATGSMFGGGGLFGSSPAFGASSGGGLFGSSTPGFGSSTPAFGSTTPAFGSTTPAFGSGFGSTTPGFGSSTPAFGTSAYGSSFGSSAPAFGSSPAFGSTTPGFGSSTPAFGNTTPAFGSMTPAFGSSTPLFGSTGSPTLFGFGQSQGSIFGQSQASPSLFGQSTQTPPYGQTPSLFGQQQQSPFGFNSGQLTTQMAPVAPLAVPLPEREIQAIFEAYKDDPGNPRYAFKHLLLSVTDPSQRIKPPGVSDIMWAEAMSKLEGMETHDRDRLYPELLLGFKDLSKRLQLQDEAIASDMKRLQTTESNVKQLQRYFQVDTVPWIQRLKSKEQELQRKLLKLMRIIETLEAKGLRLPLTRSETLLGEKLRSLVRQLQPTSAELPRRVDSVLSLSRLQAGVGGASTMLPGQLDERSLTDVQEVLKKQTEAISRLAGVLKRDMRDIEIMTDDGDRFLGVTIGGGKTKGFKDAAAAPAPIPSRYF